MQFEVFFKELNTHLENNLPLVCFSTGHGLKAYLQLSSDVFEVENFMATGFVFVPFKNNTKSILFPSHQSRIIETSMGINVEDIDRPAEMAIHPDENLFAQKQHEALVSKAIQDINSTSLEKVICSRVLKVNRTVDSLQTFQKLVVNYPSAFCYCWHHPEVGTWLGATPEQFIKLDRHILNTVSLAGTLHKTQYPEAIWTSKEYQEQQLVTDYIVGVLSQFSTDLKIGEVETVSAGNLWHLKTKIQAAIDIENLDNIIKNLHPTSAVCGMPKTEALAFIDDYEGYDRGYYAGFLGELNVKEIKTRSQRNRNQEHQVFSSIKTYSNLFVNLRCMQVFEDSLHLYIGGGITKDSDARKEYLETQAKSQTLLNVL